MTEMLIINEYSDGGQSCLNGMDIERGRRYHLEPFPFKPKGWENRDLREIIQMRASCRATACHTTACRTTDDAVGILPVTGPFYHQQQMLLSWDHRGGTCLWGSLDTSQDESGRAQRLFRDLQGLLTSYRDFHQHGLLVGQPIWERIYRDEQGIYFPDPALLYGLSKPKCELPPGLVGCHPPECFRGLQTTPASDVFYLGILFYWVLVGGLPYSLIRGWPTRALVAGDNIPVFIRRPDVNPSVGRLVDRMLAKEPDQRPMIEEIVDHWHRFSVAGDWLSSPRQSAEQQIEKKAYLRKKLVQRVFNGWWIWGSACLLLTVIILMAPGLGRESVKPTPPPLQVVRDFYQEIASPEAGFRYQNDGTEKDYQAERENRIQAVREIMAKPLVRPARIKISQSSPGCWRAQADLIEWKWNGRGWLKVPRVEYLDLKRAGSGWRVIFHRK